MSGTKTGTGGFEIDNKTYSFDPGDPSSPGQEPIQTDRGDIIVDHTPKDLGKKTRATLGKYLSDVTKGEAGSNTRRSNTFTVDPPRSSEQPDEIMLSDDKGNPIKLTPSPNSSQFSRESAEHDNRGVVFDSPDLKSWSQTISNPRTEIHDKNISGHTLLPSVGKDKVPAPIESYRKTVLRANRFSSVDRMSNDKTYKIKGRTYNGAQLKQVGAMLSLRGSQEFPAAFNDSVNPVNAGSVAGAILPSPNQLGILKVPNKLLQTQDALEHLANTTDEPIELEIAPLGNQSWGALNNVEEPFAGVLNVGMIAMALAMQAAMMLAFKGLGSLIGLMGNSKVPVSSTKDYAGRYTLGEYLTSPNKGKSGLSFPPNLALLLGLKGTRHPFDSALDAGAKAFVMGGKTTTETLSSALSDALSDSTSAGHLIIVSRLIIRTGQSVASDISKIGKAFASNPVSGIKSVVSLLANIRKSKLIVAMNLFATLGDVILSESDWEKDPEGRGSPMDAFEDSSPGASISKNRLKNKLKLAWASNRSPAMYLIPDSLASMSVTDTHLGGFKGALGIHDPDTKSNIIVQSMNDKENGTRIARNSKKPDQIDVVKMEALLESEYMPFYFHDLRTNEIISFHAFMASLSDDFTPTWENVEGFGRVEPVKIYKGTQRKIGMSFYVVSTSEEDFDEMWVKINKLVTLIYPQYTKGRTLQSEDSKYKFTQPFSQLVGASPLIRIRLGDLFKSNYSRFALARLFGAADNDMKLNDQNIKFEGVTKEDLDKVVNDAKANPTTVYKLSFGGWKRQEDGPGSSEPPYAETLNVDYGDLHYFNFKIVKQSAIKSPTNLSGSDVIVETFLMTPDDMIREFGYDKKEASKNHYRLGYKYGFSGNPKTRVISAKYIVPRGALVPDRNSLNVAFAANNKINQNKTNIDELSKFLSEKNALVKSFSSVQGKGLAGVIDSLNFDWYDKITWEIKPGSKAPKMCKITLGFSPVHDISPGIDHFGYNRAPVYNVGGLMGQGYDSDGKKEE